MLKKHTFTCWICEDESLSGMFGNHITHYGAEGLELKNLPTMTKNKHDQKQIRITIEEMDK